jgi:hypothetical protein
VFPPGPLPVDDGLTLNFGSDTGHTIGDSWEFTMTPASGGTTAFLGTLNNEDLIFKTNNIERMRLLSNGDISLVQYQSPRDDSGSYSPINFLYTDGDGNLMSAPTSLLGGGSFSLKSSDEGSTLTNDTIAFDFTGAGVTATESGGLVTVNISGGGGGSDENIYDNDGTLAGNRTLTGANNNLVFNGVNQFAAVTTTNLAGSIIRNISSTEGTFSSFAAYPKSAKQHLSGISADPSFSAGWPAEFMLYDAHDSGLGGGLLEFSGLGIDTDTGITFYSNGGNQYSFPKTDGSAGQTLVTDGSGQLSWETPAGGTSLQWYAENAAAPTTAPVATGAGSIALGNRAQALAQDMFVYGDLAGNGATNATYSNFLGANAGTSATDASFSNFIGIGTGNGATNASSSNFIGRNAGSLATDAVDSNFFGTNAGDSAANAEFSNFFGRFAGSGATDATFSNFFGRSAGLNAANASLSNFFGYRAGQSATDAGGSNFFGYSAGEAATNASLSNFIGYSAGLNATNAANSIFIGQYAGNGDSVNNTGNVNDFSILIGKSTSTGGFENSIAIGGSATNTASNQFMIGSATRPINDTVITGTGSFKLPIGTDGQRTGSPASGMVRFSSTNDCYEGYKTSGSAWSCFSTGSAGWSLTGNSGTAAGTNFIGTTDAEDFVIKVNNIETGRFTNNTEGNQYSVFLGNNAGVGAIGAHRSNFFGRDSGGNATYASGSNFLGELSGYEATNAGESNFIGSQSGRYATNASNSNFFGSSAGYSATEANNSIFIGRSAGSSASFAANSIFLGQQAGESDTVNNTGNLNDFSILIGKSTSTGGFSNSIALGGLATNTASNQLQIGSTTRTITSVFIGDSKGTASTDGTFFVGFEAGKDASTAPDSNFFGYQSGKSATNAQMSNFFGRAAGSGATNAEASNFFGTAAGRSALNAYSSNFIGYNSGDGAASANSSNFFGTRAGSGATTATKSNFLGFEAGDNATNAHRSNFFGADAGESATNANNSNFFGENAGNIATNAANSTFIGNFSGYSAVNAYNSFFVGANAGAATVGLGTQNAANSIFIGTNAGYFNADGGLNNTGSADDFSILLGNYTSTAGFENSIALGQRATNTASNQFMIGSATRPINTLILTGASGNTCTLDVTVASPSCSSDERLKTNITDLENALEKLIRVRTVNYNWINFPEAGSQIGFLAQDLEQYFPEVVSDAPNGFKTVSYGGMTPILVEAIRELNLKVTNLALLTQGSEDTETLKSSLRNWFADAANGITEIIAGTFRARNQLCVGETCLNETQVQQILQVIQSSPQNNIIIQNPGSGNSDDNNDPDDQNLDDENQSDDESDQTSTDQNNTDNSGSDDSTPVVVE